MAMHIDTKTEGERLRREKEAKISDSYKFIKIGACVIAAAAIIACVVTCKGDMKKINDVNIQREDLAKQYEIMQKQAVDNEEAIKAAQSDYMSQTDDGTVVKRQMYSSQEAGNRLAELETLNYENKLILESELEEMGKLVGKEGAAKYSLWYGDGLDPVQHPIIWKFLTWYDHIEPNYDGVFVCYTADEKYILAVRFATYDGNKNSFKFGDMYYTDFARLLENNGSIESGRSTTSGNSIGNKVDNMSDDLINSGLVTPTEQNLPTNPAYSKDAIFDDDPDTLNQNEDEFDPNDPNNVSNPGVAN